MFTLETKCYANPLVTSWHIMRALVLVNKETKEKNDSKALVNSQLKDLGSKT